jgi:hypothetical protein
MNAKYELSHAKRRPTIANYIAPVAKGAARKESIQKSKAIPYVHNISVEPF